MGGRVPPPGDAPYRPHLEDRADLLEAVTVRRPHRPRAGILDPVGAVSSLVVEAATLHATLNTQTTPQAAFDAIADAHHHLVIALRHLSGVKPT